MRQLRRPGHKPRLSADEQDDMALKQNAAFLVGFRITTGVTDEHMIDALGLLPRGKRSPSKRVLANAKLKLRHVELELADGRLSMFQRYARAVGLRFAPTLHRRRRLSSQRLSRVIQSRRRVLAKHYCRPRRHMAL